MSESTAEVCSYVEQEIVSTIKSPARIRIGLFCYRQGMDQTTKGLLTVKMISMKFLVIVMAIRYVFQFLNRIGKKKKVEEDWSGPSEHNVWW